MAFLVTAVEEEAENFMTAEILIAPSDDKKEKHPDKIEFCGGARPLDH